MIFGNVGGRRRFVFEETVLERYFELELGLQNLDRRTRVTQARLFFMRALIFMASKFTMPWWIF